MSPRRSELLTPHSTAAPWWHDTLFAMAFFAVVAIIFILGAGL